MTETPVPEHRLRQVLRETIHLSGISATGRDAVKLSEMLMPMMERLVEDTVDRRQREALWARGDTWIQDNGNEGLPPERRLTPGEYVVLRLMAQGLSIPDIARTLNMPVDTVRERRRCIYAKWKTNIPIRVVVFALHAGVLDTADIIGWDGVGST